MSLQSNPKQPASIGLAVKDLLAPIVGDFVARTSVSMASKRLGKTMETVTNADLPALAEALQPALRTLVGVPAADALIAQVRGVSG